MSRKREKAGIQTSDLHTVSLDSRLRGSDGKTELVNGPGYNNRSGLSEEQSWDLLTQKLFWQTDTIIICLGWENYQENKSNR